MNPRLVYGILAINLIGIIALIYLHFTDNERLAFIDSTKVINSYQGMAEARQDYQSKISVWKANLDTLNAELQSEMTRFQNDYKNLNVRERELTTKLIQTKQQQLQEYQRAVNEKAGAEDKLATEKVIAEINAYLKEYGEDRGYTIVLAATEYGNIAYAKDYLDITDEVIEGLNKRYRK